MGIDEGIITSVLALGVLVGLLFAMAALEGRMGGRVRRTKRMR